MIDTDLPVAWHPRGIGLDYVPCFVCGVKRRTVEPNPGDGEYMVDVMSAMHNIAAHLHKRDEADALGCFRQGARMAYYHGDRNHPQIKVGACDQHLAALEHLAAQWFISRSRVDELCGTAANVEP